MESLAAKWAAAGQGHVLQFASGLGDVERQAFQSSLEKIDLEYVKYAHHKANEFAANASSLKVEPFPTDDLAELTSDSVASDRAAWRKLGLEKIAEGKVGVLLLAGGQGTRLGTKEPKGCYDVGLPSKKSLFQVQAERLRRVCEIAQKETNSPHLVTIPWYVMTSDATHDVTMAFFEKHSFFGLDKANVFFFEQDMMPCLTPEGKLILEAKGRLAEAPNGNGGVYSSMERSGVLADMRKRGVELVCQYGVDNILIRMADPTFAGFCFARGADCGVKVVPKSAPNEAVGVLTLRNGIPGVTEYSEISKADSERRDADGKLLLGASHVCINSYSVTFLEEIAKTHFREMPPHIAKKKIPFCDPQSGETVTPPENNGWKLELFIFDVFENAKKLVAFEAYRDEEFSPLKNAPGSPSDCPETCRAAVSNLAKKWLRAAGATLVDDSADKLIEISPLLSYAGENLEKFSGQSIPIKNGLVIE